MENLTVRYSFGVGILAIALIFVFRSFYSMRIPEDAADDAAANAMMKPQ
jgi:high-affinity Fe2+/Pb2+ permease